MKNVWFNPRFANTTPSLAIFADRDGTLIRHVDYISDPEQIELLPGVKKSVHELIARGIPFFILTNQSGVGRGYFPIEKVHACQRRLFELLDLQPEDIAGWCIAPEAPGTEGGYRKPSTRFIDEALKHLAAPEAATHMIGDTLVDLETAWNVGSTAWAVGCGKPQLPAAHHAGQIDGDYEFRDTFPDCIRSITPDSKVDR
ncbi:MULTISPECIES: HAD-IIIA family hydrolase [unclassified Lentimonas]|uniref:HAD-IIIA family hydrolase n=1 Tax=unclassified Lentimonas TaxID=2630993 RepID=UPI0013227440|nr:MULTISPECIES: HAD-IIIA family hydrolase [unclassified Lentimonas]CAA6678743.1 D-glycero-D-manno-heptose 1,7-bisphosphate phosphatase (EC [Lentimonas sp. CC4]CAA6683729.1 D-glycero-D-manno-heptose 1,7-bisphosphate phosphatase (EC [Lentimonas sp. CC6]CAA6691369.1 D-glycero-D-manno-heptose 1,7-bisphosphate phosphatase (EC [Lentimonas sp. CC19]CAA6694928.1 D-glycero-D-manno-heptose 1,7-bisphosphate phosphatase (EC [Lentimonas sp. CC10]CAA7071891.1 D-glycero-D-manno-heptose 1,7-bisphosphate phos